MVMLLALIFKGLLIIGGIALVISVLLTIFTFILGIIKILFFGISVGDQTFNLPLRLKMMGIKKALNLNNSPSLQNSHQQSYQASQKLNLLGLVGCYFAITSLPAIFVFLAGILVLPFGIILLMLSDSPFFSGLIEYFSKWIKTIWIVFNYCALFGWLRN